MNTCKRCGKDNVADIHTCTKDWVLMTNIADEVHEYALGEEDSALDVARDIIKMVRDNDK